MKTRTGLHILLFFLCFCGCIYHINYINSQYFEYQTVTKVSSERPDIIRYPQITWCALLLDIINPSNLVSYNISNSDEVLQFSIGELLDMSPAENTTIKSCWLRGFSANKHLYKRYSSSECYKYFSVTKWISATSICYIIHSNKIYNYSIYNVANALTHGLDVFRIDLSEEFNNGRDINMVAVYAESLTSLRNFPLSSRRFGEIFVRQQNENIYILRPFMEIFYLLPPPYDTMCSPTMYFWKRNCVTQKTISKINLFPFTEATHDYQRMHVLSSTNLVKTSLFQEWKRIEKECEAACSKNSCVVPITSNVVYKYNNSTDPNNIQIRLSTPSRYPMVIMSVPEIFFVEWVSSISTSLSIWFGISALSFGSWNCRLSRFKLCFCSNKFSKYIRWVYWIFCVTGFLFQLSSITRDYFQYHTRSNTVVLLDDKQPYPSLGFCVYMDQILDKQKLPSNYSHYNLTARMLFEYTPGTRDLISGCSLQDKLNFGLIYHARESCFNLFTISKALRGNFVCYTFNPKNFPSLSYSWSRVASSFRQKRQLYDIWLSIKIKPNVMMIVMSYVSTANFFIPTESRCFAQKVTLGFNNVVYVSLHTNTLQALPSPYATKCIQNYNQDTCISACRRAYLALLDRLPYSEYIRNSSLDIRILDVNDLKNESVAQIVESAHITCAKICSGTPCLQVNSVSSSSISHESQSNVSLKLVSFASNKAPVVTVAVPATFLLDFFLYICNCFGIWFGLSFLSMNPIELRVEITRIKPRLFPRCQEIAQINNQKLMKAAFVGICFIGFVWQEYTLAHAYFKYQTMNRIEILNNDIFPLPNTVFCSRYTEVIPMKTWQFFLDTNSVDNGLSIKEILTMTPNTNETISKCAMRFNGSETWSFAAPKTCNLYFLVFKFVFGGHICYKFIPKKVEYYSLVKATCEGKVL